MRKGDGITITGASVRLLVRKDGKPLGWLNSKLMMLLTSNLVTDNVRFERIADRLWGKDNWEWKDTEEES